MCENCAAVQEALRLWMGGWRPIGDEWVNGWAPSKKRPFTEAHRAALSALSAAAPAPTGPQDQS